MYRQRVLVDCMPYSILTKKVPVVVSGNCEVGWDEEEEEEEEGEEGEDEVEG